MYDEYIIHNYYENTDDHDTDNENDNTVVKYEIPFAKHICNNRIHAQFCSDCFKMFWSESSYICCDCKKICIRRKYDYGNDDICGSCRDKEENSWLLD